MKKIIYLFLLSILITVGCTTNRVALFPNSTTISPTLGGKLFTAAWQQRSAEYKALCLQAYNVATWQIEKLAAEKKGEGLLPMAVVTDIDETFLDNTPNAVEQSLKGKGFEYEEWNKWCDMAIADTLCGALRFFKRAETLGFTIFYVTNRSNTNRKGTLLNLQKFGFPFADEAHLLTMKNTSHKESRRKKILEKYNIVMLLGDNLGDFSNLFESSDEKKRDDAVHKFSPEFGKKFIVLPNPNYGTWEKAMTGGSYSATKIDSVLINNLKTPVVK